jgi:hypothetical protein
MHARDSDRTRDHGEAVPAPPRTAAAARPPQYSVQSILSLQRSVGNAAVVRMLRQAGHLPAQEQHRHSADCGHRTAVQRSAVHDVLRSSGQPLDGATRADMESRLGADFSDVRIHRDTVAQRSAADLGARAYTSGNHVVIGAGGADRHTLAHELTHVIQQRRGPVSGTVTGGGLRVSDPGDAFERAAEANASRAMSRPAPAPHDRADASARAGADADAGHAPGGSAPAVQRALVVANRDYSAEYATQSAGLTDAGKKTVLDQLVNDVLTRISSAAPGNLTAGEQQAIHSESARITHQLSKAILAPVGHRGVHPVLNVSVGGTHPFFGAKNHDIKVNDYIELARGVTGWVYAKANRKNEKAKAIEILNSSHIGHFLNALLLRVRAMVERIGSTLTARQLQVMRDELTSGLSHLESQPLVTNAVTGLNAPDPARAGKPIGAYLTYFNSAHNPSLVAGSALESRVPANGGMLAVLRDPENFDIRDKMMVLHDLMEYFGEARHSPPTMGTNRLPALAADDTWSTAEVDVNGRRVRAVQDRGQNPVRQPDGSFKEHPSTRNEASDTTKLARSLNIPVWAGQSYTAARMFKLAQQSDATKQEMAAVAWGIFSFWRINFDHTTKFAYHTLHEVMDIAQNFGVGYSVRDQYAEADLIRLDEVVPNLQELRRQLLAAHGGVGTDLQTLESLATARARAASAGDIVPELPRTISDGAARIKDELVLMHNQLQVVLADVRTGAVGWAAASDRQKAEFLTSGLDALRAISAKLSALGTEWQALRSSY